MRQWPLYILRGPLLPLIWKAPEWSDINVITAILKYPSEQYNKPSWVGLATEVLDNIMSRRFDSSSFLPL
jgi:hypothetical protein